METTLGSVLKNADRKTRRLIKDNFCSNCGRTNTLKESNKEQLATVIRGSWDKNNCCSTVKRCRNKAEYFVFGDDGQPRISRVVSMPCKKHLSLAINRSLKR